MEFKQNQVKFFESSAVVFVFLLVVILLILIYEMLKAATLTERIRENPESLDHYAQVSGMLLRQLHDIEIPEGQMPRASRSLHNTVDTFFYFFIIILTVTVFFAEAYFLLPESLILTFTL